MASDGSDEQAEEEEAESDHEGIYAVGVHGIPGGSRWRDRGNAYARDGAARH